MTSLAVLSPVTPPVGVVAVAQAQSLATTQRLASSGSVFAATAGAPAGSPAASSTYAPNPIIPGSYRDPAMIALAAQANAACFIEKDAASCMALNYSLAAQMAAATCPNGAVTQDRIQKAMRGSIESWLQPPVAYATVKAASTDVASVAVAVGTLPPQTVS
jgi:hypothetical protein